MSTMVATVQDKTFLARHPVAGRPYEGLRFERCFFNNCGVYPNWREGERTRLKNIALIDCRVWACHVDLATVEEVLVDGLRTGGDGGRTMRFVVSGTALKHVVLRGRIGSISIVLAAPSGHRKKTSILRKVFRNNEVLRETREGEADAQNAVFYEDTDWALDIREAQFFSVNIQGIPIRLIRRDVATQAVVTRAAAEQRLGEALERFPELGGTHWPFALGQFLQSDTAGEILLVAAKRHPDFKKELAGIQTLREAGVAEPD